MQSFRAEMLASTLGELTDAQFLSLCVVVEVEKARRGYPQPVQPQPEPVVAKPVRKAASPRKRRGPETLAALQARHAAMRDPGYWADLRAQVAARRRELGALVQPWDGTANRRARVRRLLDAMRKRGQHATEQTVGSHGEVGSVDVGPLHYRGRLATLRAIYNAALVEG